MPGPPLRLGQEKRAKLLSLIELHAKTEVGIRSGFFDRKGIRPIGRSHADDMVEVMDRIREIVLGSSDLGDLADKFGFDWGNDKCRD